MKITISLFIAAAAFILVFFCIPRNPNPVFPDAPLPPIQRMRFSHNINEDSALHQAALRFAAKVNKKTHGQVEIEVIPAQRLGTDHQMIEMARSGEVDIILTPTAKLSLLVPEMQYADIPFLFPEREDAYALLDGEVGRMLLDHLLPYGLFGITIWENGFKHFTANKPIHTPDDFRRLKIRTMKSHIIMEQFKALGATPVPIDFYKTFQALKDGVVDGQENPLVAIAGLKFYEVQSHLILSNHGYLGYVLSFSGKSYRNLPFRIQKILVETAREMTSWERIETRKREAVFLETIRNFGTNISVLSKSEQKLFRDATKNIIYKFKDIIGDDIVNATESYLQQKYGDYRKEDIIIGLDADISSGFKGAGMAIKRGMELAATKINKAGGVLGKKVSVLSLDHKGTPARGRENLVRFAKIPNLVAVMGGGDSPVVLAETKLAREHKLPFLIPWASASQIVDNSLPEDYVFRLSITDKTAGEFIVNKAVGISNKIGLLLEDTSWGHSSEKAITNALRRRGMSPVCVDWFFQEDKDMSPQLLNMENANAGVILLVANAPDGVSVVRSIYQRTQKIPIVSNWGITCGYFREETHQELKAMTLRFLYTNCVLNQELPRHKDFMQAYKQSYGFKNEIPSPAGSVHAYDLFHILVKAVEKAGNTNRNDIRSALENIDSHQGLLKTGLDHKIGHYS
ncbi:DctP family TRAP transporter solute-binding subunit [Desulfobacula phenolica]|uniref:Tripartite ATP-independent transporter solute receptor, DctP family n=1 Tax=Desulfobacula phenolica TaxID=90732 RepID=A0A1H2JAH9_9BACT|nr:DctP family TRAP transporter solute-binding subunit [Desulfobacula phenolica]SDU53058.1 tripartite ATP-independent transporter solute receptor, DctP family [Desulfobacula phenolica]